MLIELDSDPAVMRYLTGGEPEEAPEVKRERYIPGILAGYESKGYATEVSQALLSKAFTEVDVRLVWGEAMCVNRPSQKVMEKAGMTIAESIPTPDDMLKVEDAELGGLRYEIAEEQWEQQRGAE